MLNQFFITDVENVNLMTGSYKLWLVILSVFVASMTSFFALRLAAMARHIVDTSHQRIALLSGSFIMAGGVWSMHFIGMLAFKMPHQHGYDLLITTLSVLPAIISSYIMIKSLIDNNDSLKILVRNGIVVGSGIGAMHYLGMEAMQMDIHLLYDPYWFALSIVVAVALSFIALSARRALRSRFPAMRSLHIILISSVTMGCAIAGMHYTGMEAARFIIPDSMSMSEATAHVSEQSFLAIGVAIATLFVSTLAVNVSSQLRYRQLLTEKTAGEARLQAILDTATDGVITINAKGIIQGINGAARRIFGWQEHEVVGKNVSILMPNPHRDAHDSYLSRYFETGEERIIGSPREVYAQHKQGHLIPVRLGVGRVNLKDGETLFVGFVADISDRKAMEERLRESQERLSSLMQNIPGASFRRQFDKEWTPIFLSEGMFDISGYSSRLFLNQEKSFAKLVFEDDFKYVCDRIQSLDAHNSTYAIEYRLKHQNGEPVWVLENGLVVRDDQGNVKWIDGVMINISNLKQVEQELINAKLLAEEAAESKANFLANMSHEIRTPMNAIIGFTDILLDSTISGENRRHLETIEKASRSLLHLLNDILDSAKLEKNKLDVQPVAFNLANCVDTVISTLWLNAKGKGIDLSLTLSDELPEVVFGAEDRIRQVLMNLVGNGVKFTESGSVSLDVTAVDGEKDMIRFSVTDTGIGIAPERVSAIFDPFTQADSSMSRRFGGTGLGTTISRQLVHLMGGEIYATSELGKGSCFYFDLPLPASELESQEQSDLKLTLPPLRILVCDDIEQNRNLLKILLERDGHTVITADDGIEAIERYQADEPELILMDLQMPRLDGLGASREIRNWEQKYDKHAVPIVALTASVLAEDRYQAQAAGMNGFANKPIDMAQLTQEIARSMNLRLSVESSAEQTQPKQNSRFKLIHLHNGLKLWGDEHLYATELRNMVEKHLDLPAQFKHLVDNHQWEELAGRSHAMKGLSGNFALISLHHLFSQLEKAADDHQISQAQHVVKEITDNWPTLCKEVATLADKLVIEPKTTTTMDDIDTEQLRDLLTEWLKATQAGELREDIAENVQHAVPASVKKPIVDAINAIDDFDFNVAASHLESALETLQ